MGLGPAEYGEQLLALLPRGRAWTRAEGAVLRRLAEGIGIELANVDLRAAALRDEVDPRTTNALLSDWERVLGLPDPCVPRMLSFEERRSTVLARLAARGGQSRQFYIDLAQALGFTISIEEYTRHTCLSPCNVPITDETWVHTWSVVAPLDNIRESTCLSPCNEPLRSWGNEILECAIERVKPAHTQVLFRYVPAPAPRHLVCVYIDDSYPWPVNAELLGWPEGEGPAYENRFPRMPFLESICAQGMRFRNLMATAVCSPGRADWITGVHQTRHGLGTVTNDVNAGALAEFGDPGFQWKTLPQKLAEHAPDVRFGWFGKVHLGMDANTEGGLGYEIVNRLGPMEGEVIRANLNQQPHTEGGTPGTYYTFRTKVLGGEESDQLGYYATQYIFDRARDWVRSTSYTAQDRLYVHIWQSAVHTPFDAPPEEAVATEEYLLEPPTAWRRNCAMMEAFDHYLRQFWESLPEDFRERATLLVCSDNGPDGTVIESGREDDGKDFGAAWDALIDDVEARVKQSVYRFGVWAQGCAMGPGIPAGAVSDAPLQIVDLHRTILDYFGVDDPAPTDGISFYEHLYGGDPPPRYRGLQFSSFFRPNGHHAEIVAAPDVWSASEDYLPGAEVLHIARNFVANVASGPSHGGPVEPGATGSSTEWSQTSFANYRVEADVDIGKGPDFSGRFSLVRRLGFPDRVWHLFRPDGSPVHPFELPGQEIGAGGIGNPVEMQIQAVMVGLLEEHLASTPGPRECIAFLDAAGNRGSVHRTSTGFAYRNAGGQLGTLAATFRPGDIPGEVRYRFADGSAATLLLSTCIPVRGEVPFRFADGQLGSIGLVDGAVPYRDASGELGGLLVGAQGVQFTDATGVTGHLPLV